MELAPLDRRRFLRIAAMSAASVLVTACASNTASTSTASSSAAATTSVAATSGTTTTAAAASTAAGTTAAAQAASTAATSSQAITLASAQTSATSAASVAGGKYKEAPQLAALVKAGSLPAVDQRLPANPRVIKPLQSVGEYGGTWHRAYQGLSDRWGPTKLMEEPLSRWEAPDVNTIQVVPNFAEKWDQNSDATEFTFHLRKGLKWSDGQPVTTDDAKFWWEDVQQNKDLVTAPSFAISQQVAGKTVLASVDFPDQFTIHIKYAKPFPLLPIFMAKLGGAGPTQPAFIVPSHYLKSAPQSFA